MQAIIDQDHGSRHEKDGHIGEEMPENLLEEPIQGIIFAQVQHPEQEYESERLTCRKEEGPEVVVRGRSQDLAVHQCHNSKIGELTLNLLWGSTADFCMDVLHSEEAHKEDQSTLPHAVEYPAPKYPFVK